MRERLTTWYFTGPAGHFVAGVADWAELMLRYAAARTRAKVRARP
jgi:hypothetical protein